MQHDKDVASGLFRTEALVAVTERLGRPINPPGISSWMLIVFFVLILIVAIVFLAVGEYARKETVSGRVILLSGTPRVVSTRPGVAESVLVREGQRVKRGAIMVVATSDMTLSEGRRLGEALEIAASNQSDAKLRDLRSQIERINRQHDETTAKHKGLLFQTQRLREQIKLQRDRIYLSKRTYDDLKPLYERKQIAAIEYRQRELELIGVQQGLSSLQRDLDNTLSQVHETNATLGVLDADRSSANAKLAVEMAILSERRANLDSDRQFKITAPVDGIVTALTTRPGSPIIPNGTLAVLVPENAVLQAELWVPSRAIGFVRKGQDVRLMYDPFPFERFGFGHGRVAAVSSAPIPPIDLVGTVETNEPLFRVEVELNASIIRAYGEEWPLMPGMRLSADLILEKRSFSNWILDPLRAATVRN